MPSPPPRPTLPTSSTEFALPPPSSSASLNASSSSTAPFPSPSEEINPLLLRFRRPSLLGPRSNSEGRLHSPLAISFTLPLSRRYSTSIPSETGEESESDKDKMWTDSPPSVDSGSNTPAMLSDPSSSVSASLSNNSTLSVDSEGNMKASRPRSPSTPPPKTTTRVNAEAGSSQDVFPSTTIKARRLSHPIKMPRILTLLAEEAHPGDDEVKSEAQFQRFMASCSDLPLQPRTPRAASDRGRYPEEVPPEEPTRENTPSDDEDEGDTAPFAFGASEPITINKPVTPAHSVNGDEFLFSDSPGGVAMDVDLPSSVYGSPNLNSWRYTPPPTSSAVRSNKRKYEDRYDPYPTANKRRAVSPSLSYLRENQPSLFNPRAPNSSRVAMPLPIAIPSGLNSGASSPVFPSSGSGLTNGRPLSYGSASAMSSPTLRAQIGLASPILRPMIRARREGEFKEVDGAGEAVNGLTLE